MSKYGVRINNYEAASLYEYKYGFRSFPDTTKAMLVNSLFLDFLKNQKLLNITKRGSTRDIICIQFNYGTKSYEEATENIRDKIEKTNDLKIKDKLEKIKNNLEKNKSKCIRKTRQELREDFYKDGIDIAYRGFDKKTGKEQTTLKETIHYKMLYRTPGKAKKGTCMFVRSEIYDEVHNFLYMGITLPKENSPIVEMGAYSSLITSSIVGKIKILPSQILVVKDVDSIFKTKVLSVETDENRHCLIKEKENYEVKNTMFDGQALIDTSIFPEYADGYILLRHHMTKFAAFHTDITQFMKDYYGEEYENAVITDMFGRNIKVCDIKIITTENALKWMKFGVSFDYWASWIEQNGCMFGIVKTAHESKLGDVQRMSYQMMNSLDMESMDVICQKSVDYVNKLKNDNSEFIKYLERNKTFSNDFEVLIALCKHNRDFVNSEYFRERKQCIINAYILGLKNGHSIQNADNLTIVGSPYAMLMHSVGQNPSLDPTLRHEDGCVQCYTERFNDGEFLASFRSPHNSCNNIGYLHNCYSTEMKKYFKLGQLCIAINMNGTDFQDRHNGSDQDSDSIYTTNQPNIVTHAKKCYKHYPTIVNNIPKDKNIYNYDMVDFARVDNNLAASQLAIGESSNLAQICLTYTYNYKDQKYKDYVCILSVLAQVAVDSAKRAFDIDLSKEIRRIKNDMDIPNNGLPKFWLLTKRDKQKKRTEKERRERDKKNKARIRKKVNEDLVCPMNKVYDLEFDRIQYDTEEIPMEKFWIKHELSVDRRKAKKVELLISKYSLDLYEYNASKGKDNSNYLLLMDDFENLIKDIRVMNLSEDYLGLMSWLINRAFCISSGVKRNKETINSTMNKNRALLLKVLYVVSPELFLQCFVHLI